MKTKEFGICDFCGYNAHDAVRYQMRQNNEKLSPEEYREEVEFYLFENHPDHCPGMAKLVEEHDRSVKKTDENFEVTWDVIKLWDNCPICLGDAAKCPAPELPMHQCPTRKNAIKHMKRGKKVRPPEREY